MSALDSELPTLPAGLANPGKIAGFPHLHRAAVSFVLKKERRKDEVETEFQACLERVDKRRTGVLV
jgi:hypothetical protein